MTTTPTFSTTFDFTSNRLQHDSSGIHPIPLIDDYNSYYSDPDYDFDPYWDTHSYNQQHLYFYNKFDKQTQDIEPDSLQSDQTLNKTPTNVCVDQWQQK